MSTRLQWRIGGALLCLGFVPLLPAVLSRDATFIILAVFMAGCSVLCLVAGRDVAKARE